MSFLNTLAAVHNDQRNNVGRLNQEESDQSRIAAMRVANAEAAAQRAMVERQREILRGTPVGSLETMPEGRGVPMTSRPSANPNAGAMGGDYSGAQYGPQTAPAETQYPGRGRPATGPVNWNAGGAPRQQPGSLDDLYRQRQLASDRVHAERMFGPQPPVATPARADDPYADQNKLERLRAAGGPSTRKETISGPLKNEAQMRVAATGDIGGDSKARDREIAAVQADLQRVKDPESQQLLHAQLQNLRNQSAAYGAGTPTPGGATLSSPSIMQRVGQAATAIIPSAEATPVGEGQYFAPLPQVDSRLKLLEMQIQQTAQLAQVERDPGKIAQLQAQHQQLLDQHMETQIMGAATRARNGDINALSQLGQVAQVAFMQTPQGFLLVDPYTKSPTPGAQPMNASQMVTMLYGSASRAARAAAAKNYETQQGAFAKKSGEVAAELPGQIAMEQAKAQALIQKEMQAGRNNLALKQFEELTRSGQVKEVKELASGETLVFTNNGGAFRYQPGMQGVGGFTTEPQFTPVAGIGK